MGVTEERTRQIAVIARYLKSTIDLNEMMSLVIKETTELLGADRGVLLLSSGGRGVDPVAEYLRSGLFSDEDRSHSHSVIEEVHATGRPFVTSNIQDSRFRKAASVRGMGKRSVLCTPLFVGERFLGALYFDSATANRSFGAEDARLVEAISEVAALGLENARVHSRWEDVVRISEGFSDSLDPISVLNGTIAQVVRFTHAHYGAILLMDEMAGRLRVVSTRSDPVRQPGIGSAPDQAIVDRVVASGDVYRGSTAVARASEEDSRQGLSVMCVPIRTGAAVAGVVYLETRVDDRTFAEEDEEHVLFVADRAGMSLENSRLHSQAAEVVNTLANAIEARDEGTSLHVQRVATFATAVGKCLDISEEGLHDLARSTALHDIGKIGIPDSILLKDGPLDDLEWRTMKRHPEIGVEIVQPIRLSRDIQLGILTHHEAVDGSGYPRGLRGPEIPLFGKVIAVVDSYDAMTSVRCYRRVSKTPREASAELRRCAGVKYDPVIVEKFISVLDES